MPAEKPGEALPLPVTPSGDPAEQRILAFAASVCADSQDEDTIRCAIYVAASCLKALRRRRGQTG